MHSLCDLRYENQKIDKDKWNGRRRKKGATSWTSKEMPLLLLHTLTRICNNNEYIYIE